MAEGCDSAAQRKWMQNWHKTSAAFGVISGVMVLILAYSSSILGKGSNLGLAGPALLYSSWIFSSCCLSAQVAVYLGSKKAMVVGFVMADIFYVAFTFAASLEASWLRALLAGFGYCLSGIGAGIFWTAEGAYFARSAELLAQASGGKLEDHTNEMAAVFAAWNFVPEVCLKVMTATIESFDLPHWVPMGSACAVACAMTLYMAAQMEALPEATTPKATPSSRRCVSASALWRDPALWLLSFTNLTFGLAGALINGKINCTYTSPQLGLPSVGLMMAMLSLVGLAAQWPYEKLVRLCGKISVMWIGAASFAALACCALLLDLGSLGHRLVLIYVLQGLGRAAYESTNRANFADFWPPPSSEDAFANVTMQQAVAFTAGFLLQMHFDIRQMASTLLVLAALIMPGFYAARRLRMVAAPPEEVANDEELAAGS